MLPRYTVAVTLTNDEKERMEEMCTQDNLQSDALILRALAELDKAKSGSYTSIFERRPAAEQPEST